MTDELKAKFQALVQDAPEPTGVPSDAVFARIKIVRRRRTTGVVAGLAAAAVGTIALIAGNLTGVDSAPPVVHTPNGPTPTAVVPTTTPTTEPSKPSVSVPTKTVPPAAEKTNTPPTSQTSPPKTEKAEAPPPVELDLSVTPSQSGAELSVSWRWSGSVLAPINEFTGKTLKTDGRLRTNAYSWDYDWGDGRYEPATGQNGGGLSCEGANRRIEGSWSSHTETHTYLKPGTYTFSYRLTYCGPNGTVPIEKTLTIKVAGTTGSPSP